MKKIVISILVILLFSGLTGNVLSQDRVLPKLKEGVAITNKTLPAAVDKNLALEGQPRVTVTTNEVKNITSSGATCYYSVKFEGLAMGVDIKASSGGVCVSKSTGPTINNTKFGVSKNCSATGATTCSDISGLSPNSKYYVRAFYTITEGKITGTFYGNELTFTTAPATGTK